MNKTKKIEIAIGALIIILAAVFIIQNAFTESPEEQTSPASGDTEFKERFDEDDVEEVPEQATSDNPHTPIVNPELMSGESKVLGTSFFNMEFDECESEGAYLNISCPGSVSLDVDSDVKSIPLDKEGLVLANVTAEAPAGVYRCSFDIVCGEHVMASSSTVLKIKS
ncbi:MAG: hypothetical protein ACOCU6_02620 [Nanoarchaeota archaeon]